MKVTGRGINAGSVVPGPEYQVAGNNKVGETIVVPKVALTKQTWTNPAAADDDAYILAAGLGVAGPNATTTTYVRSGVTGTAFDGANADGSLDFPRNAYLTVTHATSIVAMDVQVTGIDIHGKAVTENLAVTATGTSKTTAGKIAFRRIDSIAAHAAGNAAADAYSVGFGQVFGLEFRTNIASLVKEVSAGSVVTNGTVVAGNGAANTDYRGTYSPNTAPDATKTYSAWYLVDDPTDGIT